MPTLIFKETEACNSNCIYCDVIARKKPKTISMDHLKKVFVYINEYLEKFPNEYFSIVWHGGEPLIVGVDFYRKVLEFQETYCSSTKSRIEHDIQSNLTLITHPEILPRKFFKGLYETQEMAFLEISIAVTYA